jgi:hypothetical protein
LEPEEKGWAPPQQVGGQSNTEASRGFDSEDAARSFYQQAKSRLLQVNEWQLYAGAATAKFQLTNTNGQPVNRNVQVGDHFQIDIPGPGPMTGEGYDWVQVESVDEGRQDNCIYTVVCVRPATNPKNKRSDIAHFFTGDATSSFVVRVEGRKVIAAVYGRNEKPNIEAETIIDKTRNAAVAGGAMAVGSKLQWKSLVDGILNF